MSEPSPKISELIATNVHGVRFYTRKNLKRIHLNPREIAVLETLRDWPARSEATRDEPE